jgi:hypothetical protein
MQAPGLGQRPVSCGKAILGGTQRTLGCHRVGPDRVPPEFLQAGDGFRRGGVAATRGGRALHLLLQGLGRLGHGHDLGLADTDRGSE